MADFVIFVPLQEEMRYAYEQMEKLGGECFQPYDSAITSYSFDYRDEKRQPAVVEFFVIGDMGNLRTASRLAACLSQISGAHAIFLLGIAGSMDRKIGLGDVLVGTAVKTFYPDKVAKIDPTIHDFVDLKAVTPATGLISVGEGEVAELTMPEGTPEPAASAAIGPAAPPYRLDARKRVLTESFFRYRRDAINWERSGSQATDYIRKLGTGPLDKGQFKLQGVTADQVPGLLPEEENPNPKVTTGLVFSSEMVIDSEEYIEFLTFKDEFEHYDLYFYKDGKDHKRRRWFKRAPAVIDMETLGFFMMLEALKGSNTAIAQVAFSIRGVSDRASQKALLDGRTEDEVRRIAVQNAMNVALDMMNHINAKAIGNSVRL